METIDPILARLGLDQPPCPIIWSNKHLHFFEAGAFFQSEKGAWIELNTSRLVSFLGYNYEVVLEHELIHAMRSHFEDSIWEEMLAYQVSKKSYQKCLGPFLSQLRGRLVLMLSPCFIIISDLVGYPYFGLILCFLMWMIIFMPYYRLYSVFVELVASEGLACLIKSSPEQLNAIFKDRKKKSALNFFK
jgi:hypothetical protein